MTESTEGGALALNGNPSSSPSHASDAGGGEAGRSPLGLRRSSSAAKINRLGSPNDRPPPKVAALLRPRTSSDRGNPNPSGGSNSNRSNSGSHGTPNARAPQQPPPPQQQDEEQDDRHHRPISPSPHGTKGKRGKHVITPSGEGNSDSDSPSSNNQQGAKDKGKAASQQDAAAAAEEEEASSLADEQQQKKRAQTPTNPKASDPHARQADDGAAAHAQHHHHPPVSPWTSYLTNDRSAAPPAGLFFPGGVGAAASAAGGVRTPRVFDFSGLGTPRDDPSVTFARNLAAITSPGVSVHSTSHHRRGGSFGSAMFGSAALSPMPLRTPIHRAESQDDATPIHRTGSQESGCPSESEAFQSLLHASDALFGTTADPRHAGEGGGSLISLSASVGAKKPRGRPRKDSTASATAAGKKKAAKGQGSRSRKQGNLRRHKQSPYREDEQRRQQQEQEQQLQLLSTSGSRRSRSSRGMGGGSDFNPQASSRSLLLGSTTETRIGDAADPPSVRRTFHDGEYEGQIVGDGRRHGYGVMQFFDGDKYAGWWCDDVMDGMGRMEYSDG